MVGTRIFCDTCFERPLVSHMVHFQTPYGHLKDPFEAAGRKKGPPRTLLFGTHCQELCASAKGASEFGGYASVGEFPDDSECLLRKDSESMGTGMTQGLCEGRVLREGVGVLRYATCTCAEHGSHSAQVQVAKLLLHPAPTCVVRLASTLYLHS